MLTDERFEDAYQHLDDKIDTIREDVQYLRGRIDGMVWRIIGIGAGSGAMGFVISLLLSRV